MVQDKIYTAIPEGWSLVKGATNHPHGYAWISNGKSLFDPERRIALLKED